MPVVTGTNVQCSCQHAGCPDSGSLAELACVCTGFVRMAIEHNSKLVPVVVLGEVSALQNPIDLPNLQRWTYKNLGFPVPYWVVGRWGVSPFPKKSGLKFIIGEPLSPRPHVPGTTVQIQPFSSVVNLSHTMWLTICPPCVVSFSMATCLETRTCHVCQYLACNCQHLTV